MTLASRCIQISGRGAFLALAAVCAACAPFEIVTLEGGHITYRHPFTESGAAEVNKSAERLCTQYKQVPIKVNSACSLTECTTRYQCVNKADAELYR